MEQNTRPAPDNDLEAYGDWVTVDRAVPPAAAVRQPSAAAAEVEIVGELTDAEEEFLGELSEADHAAATAAGAGHPTHNGNGKPESGPADAATAAVGEPWPADQPPVSAAAAAPAGAAAPVAGAYPARAAEPAPTAPAPPATVMPSPLPAVPAPRAAAPQAAVPQAAVSEPTSAAQPAPRPRQAAADLPATAMAPVPRSAGTATAAAAAATEEVDRDALASLATRIATLAAEVTAIATEVDRLQADGAPAAPAPATAGDADQVQVTLEELDSEQPADTGAPAAPAAAAHEAAAGRDSHPAPVIRLVPISDEEEAEIGAAAAAVEAEGAAGPADAAQAGAPHAGAAQAGAAQAGAEPPPDASPAPSPDLFRNDVRDVLGYLDQLLDDLPPERVREFAQSPQFATYKALFAELGLDD